MLRPRVIFLLAAGLLLSTQPTLAANYAVGTCKPSLPSYPTISAAVSGVPPYSTVEVCPNTYPEQVTIAQPLTLKGIASGNSSQSVITVPAGGLATTPGVVGTIAPQVEVTSGPVIITNITVDGTDTTNCTSAILVGIYYGSGSSGTVNEATVRNETRGGCGFGAIGILAENATATNESVTIQNSSVHDVDDEAIVADSNQTPPTLTATIKGDYLESSYIGVYQYFGAGPGSVTGNVVTAGTAGIVSVVPSVTLSGNTVTSSPIGIYASASGDNISSNKIWNSSSYGIDLGASGLTVQSNFIAKSSVGIEFFCETGNTVSHNTINDATTGLDQVPASFGGANSFDNVATLRTDGCGSAPNAAQHPSLIRAPAH
jgi:hypothetical protein